MAFFNSAFFLCCNRYVFNEKELTRELRVTKKRLEQIENSSTIANATQNNDGVSLGSRTSSNTSINTAGIVSFLTWTNLVDF